MPLYVEGLVWYLVLLDALIYNVLAWAKGRWHEKATHWISDYFPINKFIGLWYLIMVLWVGFALLRMQIILFR